MEGEERGRVGLDVFVNKTDDTGGNEGRKPPDEEDEAEEVWIAGTRVVEVQISSTRISGFPDKGERELPINSFL
jgi:hypothetical protein